MTIDLSLKRLTETLTWYHFAYLLTVDDNDRAHVVAVYPTLANDTWTVPDLVDS